MDREKIKAEYPPGARVELLEMNDPQAPPKGTKGRVCGIDAMGDILISWDNGSELNAIYGVDKIRLIKPLEE